MLLLDQGLPRSAVVHLRTMGITAVHAGEIGLSTASDTAILEHARRNTFIVATLDAEFHTHLALTNAAGPSVIRIRIEGLRGAELAGLLENVLKSCGEDLSQGAFVSVSERSIRIRRLPIVQVC